MEQYYQVESLFADKSAAWQTFILTCVQIKLNLSLNETTVFGFLCFIPKLAYVHSELNFWKDSQVGIVWTFYFLFVLNIC